jgi:hypothetical protein
VVEQPEPRPFFEACPDEVLHQIAARINDGAALSQLRLVNKRWKRVADSDDLWRDQCVAKWGACPHAAPEPPVTWAAVYKFNAAMFYRLLLQGASDAVNVSLRRAGAAARMPPIRLPAAVRV